MNDSLMSYCLNSTLSCILVSFLNPSTIAKGSKEMAQDTQPGVAEPLKLQLVYQFSPTVPELLRTRGYIIRDTIGEGTYSKVKVLATVILFAV